MLGLQKSHIYKTFITAFIHLVYRHLVSIICNMDAKMSMIQVFNSSRSQANSRYYEQVP